MIEDENHPAYRDASYSNYLSSRLDMLRKMAFNHARWEHGISKSGTDSRTFEHWCDGDGCEHLAVITYEYLNVHRAMLKRVINDMEALGPFARFIADRVLYQQRAAFEQSLPTHERISNDEIE